MNSVSEDLKQNPLWVYRVSNYTKESSGIGCNKLLKKWKFHKHIRQVLKDKNINEFFPVQEKSIPLLLNNLYKDELSVLSCDFIITAPTGQGKTLCYVLPLINNILNLRENRLLALVVVPSRELVKQIYEVFSWFMDDNPLTYDLRGSLLKVRVYYGDRSFVKCHKALSNDPPHIAICTPGVLVEYMEDFGNKDSYLNFKYLRWIVIDEVDMMLNQTVCDWVGVIVDLSKDLKSQKHNHNSEFPQKILVSATIPLKSHEIQNLELNRPILLRLDDMIYKLPKTLKQNCIFTSKRLRPLVLLKLLSLLYKKTDLANVLVFLSKIEDCHKTARFLQIYFKLRNISFKVFEFSSKLSQKQRNKIINTYKSERRVCLLCSDLASRGIDLSNTSVVVSYDFPSRLSTYIHRAGRTARGNKEGLFYIFVSEKNQNKFNRFIKKLKIKHDKLNKVDQEVMIEEKKTKKIQEDYLKVVEMHEKLLELESSKKIQYNTDIESCWNLLE